MNYYENPIVLLALVVIIAWLLKYYSMTNKPETIGKFNSQIKDKNIPLLKRLGIFTFLEPLKKYPGFYSPYSMDDENKLDYEKANVDFPNCPNSTYRQCTNNVYLPDKDSSDFFIRRNFENSEGKCEYGATYSSCFTQPKMSELEEIKNSACRINKMKEPNTARRVNMFNWDGTQPEEKCNPYKNPCQ